MSLDPYPYRVETISFDGTSYTPRKIRVTSELNARYPEYGIFDPREGYEQDESKYL